MSLTLEDGKALVRLARISIETFFSGKLIDFKEYERYKEKRGVFVTLELDGHLRGCIGFPYPEHPLKRAIIEAARAAAFKDPRFSPLTESEINDITVEVSILTEPELIEAEEPKEYLFNIEIGKHGLIIMKGYYSGLLLPQVFPEQDCTPKEALEMTCEKAGLDKDDWKESDTRIYLFSAQVFYEEEPNGKVLEKIS